MLVSPLLFFCQDRKNDKEFQQLNDCDNWKLAFSYSGSEDWKDNWFLDGELANITNSDEGMYFKAGPEDKNDAHHAVLWTKESFEGDIKIEFDYTKTDSMQKNVTILYIQATGTGEVPYETDITEWNEIRKIPSMRTYFNNMNTLHISYAAFDPTGKEYVRARRYPVTKEVTFKDMMLAPSYDNLKELFIENIKFHITVIKTKELLFFKVDSENKSHIFEWDLTQKDPIVEGNIGLRHMFTRSALYKDFEIYVKR